MKAFTQNLLHKDLEHILDHTRDYWEDIRGGRLFITGGTGFVGAWLLESFAEANEKLSLGAEVVALSRNPEAFQKKAPHLASLGSIQWHRGDVRNFEFPKGSFSHVIHAAAEVEHLGQDSLAELDILYQGTKHVLEFTRHSNTEKFLLVSSGGVYGKQPSDLFLMSEDHQGGPDPCDPNSFYGEGKRLAELLCTQYGKDKKVEIKIARGFTFLGPYQPLNANFAAGNFIHNIIKEMPITIKGDGTGYRSYLYASDMALWLWIILCKGKPLYPYNVGSDKPISILELGEVICRVADSKFQIKKLKQATPGKPRDHYVPNVDRAKTELGLKQYVSLEEGVKKTVSFYNNSPVLL